MENTEDLDSVKMMEDSTGSNGNWYTNEARSLGALFGIKDRKDRKTKGLMEHLNLNFGINGKGVKKGRHDDNVELIGAMEGWDFIRGH